MPDITMCMGDGCKLKEDCYRYKAKPSTWQSYFSIVPYDEEHGCDHYWERDTGRQDSGERKQ